MLSYLDCLFSDLCWCLFLLILSVAGMKIFLLLINETC